MPYPSPTLLQPQPLGAMVGSALLAASLALNLSPAFVQPVLADEEVRKRRDGTAAVDRPDTSTSFRDPC